MVVGVTGAAGKTGRALTRALLARQLSVRALVRTPAHGEWFKDLEAVTTAIGDMRNAAEVAAGLAGVEVLYHIPPNMEPAEGAMIEAALEAAAEIEIGHFVYHSVLHPQIRSMPHHWRKLAAEEAVLESGLPFTILQPAAYMQNLRSAFARAAENGRFRIPYGPSVRISIVDLADIAQAAARVISVPGHRGAIYELAGREAPSQAEVADCMGAALGRSVQVERVPLEQWATEARTRGLPPERIDDFLAMYRHYQDHDFIGNASTLEGLLGRRPTPLWDVLRRWLEGQE